MTHNDTHDTARHTKKMSGREKVMEPIVWRGGKAGSSTARVDADLLVGVGGELPREERAVGAQREQAGQRVMGRCAHDWQHVPHNATVSHNAIT
jgi:hypothetical protein